MCSGCFRWNDDLKLRNSIKSLYKTKVSFTKTIAAVAIFLNLSYTVCFIYTNILTTHYTYVFTFVPNCSTRFGVFYTTIRSTHSPQIIPGYSVYCRQHRVRLLLVILTTYKNHIITITNCSMKDCKSTLKLKDKMLKPHFTEHIITGQMPYNT